MGAPLASRAPLHLRAGHRLSLRQHSLQASLTYRSLLTLMKLPTWRGGGCCTTVCPSPNSLILLLLLRAPRAYPRGRGLVGSTMSTEGGSRRYGRSMARCTRGFSTEHSFPRGAAATLPSFQARSPCGTRSSTCLWTRTTCTPGAITSRAQASTASTSSSETAPMACSTMSGGALLPCGSRVVSRRRMRAWRTGRVCMLHRSGIPRRSALLRGIGLPTYARSGGRR
mmetsp:Transcript_26074/g.64409  ORF Transcript_26074/g.64409 Transcript_26074/m.64409 type:complete len:226 (+) Transcript_26074:904-1581(+)